MTGVRTRVEAFIDWSWDYFSKSRGPQILDRSDVARIDWGDDDQDDQAEPGGPPAAQDAAGSVAAP
jgi:NADH:quinone reductase (non-electrogenic)